jgi:hypothetical protein
LHNEGRVLVRLFAQSIELCIKVSNQRQTLVK